MTGASSTILALCRGATDERAFRVDVLAALRRILSFEHYVWLLTDPETSVGSSPVAYVPDLTLVPDLIRRRYVTREHRWTTQSDRVVVTRTMVTLVLRDRFGCWGFVDLWTDPSHPPDSAAVDLVRATVPSLTTALRRCLAGTFTASAGPARRTGPAVIMLTDELRMLGQTAETERILRMLLPPPAALEPIPAAAFNVAAQLLAVEAAVDANPAWARVRAGDLWCTLRAARFGGDIAVTIEAASPSERLGLFSRVVGLSPREAELLTLLAAGLDTRELARRTFVSELTVQDQFKSIFVKASVHTRRELMSRAVGA